MTRKPISKLLVAGRGEIAGRVMTTAHRLGIATVAVYSDPDAVLPFVAQADEAVRLPGSSAAQTYLRTDAILAAAAATGADAVHPGYGFLAENAGFARDCARAGLTFVGPPPDVIAEMGSKTRAKAVMAAAGVPVLPGITLAGTASDPAGVTLAGTASDPAGVTLGGGTASDPAGVTLGGAAADTAGAAAGVGFPLLVKAVHGGGGRGMRLVTEPAGLAAAVAAAGREATAAFGDGTVFLERFVPAARHVEVQIAGDSRGTIVHLFERECSIQRRYQKIIEESPSPAVGEPLRAALGEAAVTAARAICYRGVGTVEFVLDQAGGFWFLEVNTRLQVEHRVTEMVTGLDLVELQLRIAEGEPLPAQAAAAAITGHAIEARLYAEDVAAGFLPATGTLHRFFVPAGPGVRVDAGYADGSPVSPHYDAMLGKVIAHASTRTDAARLLARTLARSRLHGVSTNRDLLLGILREPEFLAGQADTGYLDRHDPAALSAVPAEVISRHAAAAALARGAAARDAAPVLASLPAGWRNVPAVPARVSYRAGGEACEVTYQQRGGELDLAVNGQPLARPVVHLAAPDGVDLEVAGIRRRYAVDRVPYGGAGGGAVDDGGAAVYVDGPDGSTALQELPRFRAGGGAAAAGSLLAPMPGTVARVLAGPGSAVTAGQPLVMLDSMKMEHAVTAPADGVLAELRVKPGDQVTPGDVLAVLESG